MTNKECFPRLWKDKDRTGQLMNTAGNYWIFCFDSPFEALRYAPTAADVIHNGKMKSTVDWDTLHWKCSLCGGWNKYVKKRGYCGECYALIQKL